MNVGRRNGEKSRKHKMNIYWQILLVLLVYFTILFIIGQLKKDNSIVDIGWGLGFVIVGWFSFSFGGGGSDKRLLLTGLVTVWGLRLAYHIGKRNWGKPEDYRYVKMRQRWGKHFPRLKAYLNVYILQLGIMYIVSLPVIYGNAATKPQFIWLSWLGIGVWTIGFLFESIGDYQLKRFKANPANRGKICDRGLWAYTRHPNYFGDATMWWGLFLIAVNDWSGGWTAIGPALMTYFLIFVSGAKLLEKKYAGRKDYEQYKTRTSGFFPLPRKK